jgi:hypothetical protein
LILQAPPDSQILLPRDVGYLGSPKCLGMAEETANLLYRYQRTILQRIEAGTSRPSLPSFSPLT